MSKSIHVTIKDFKGLTKSEIDEQSSSPDSDLNIWRKKSVIKKHVKSSRKNQPKQKP